MLPSMWATIGPATRSDRTSPHGTPNREHAKGRQDPQRHRDQSLQEHHGEGLVDVMPSGLRTALLGAGQRRLFLDLFGRAPSAFVRGIRQGYRLFSTHGLEVIQSTHDPRQNDVLGHACDKSCLFHSFPAFLAVVSLKNRHPRKTPRTCRVVAVHTLSHPLYWLHPD